ncbi:MAG: SDR family oxidoreductase [Chloroflexi bacterium]|nr:SDR family oxidoreductase [Chloroflexota bacterium]
MHGKTVLITGGTNGIGLETARELARLGARVVITGRNPAKTASALEDLKRTSGNPNITSLLGDLSLMRETRRIAAEFSAQYDRLDVLINNAGGVFQRREFTEEGLEYTFALNHMSYYLLTRLLLDKLTASTPARIINVSSGAHFLTSGVNFENLQCERGTYSGFRRYSESKLMNVLFTLALARRVDSSKVTVNAVHPGLVHTGFGANNGGIVGRGVTLFSRVFGRTPEKGAETSIHVASSAEGGQISGAYWDTSKVTPPSKQAVAVESQERLWRVSAELAGLPTG